MEYNNLYSVKHLSIRVPWHDNAWNGTICANPKNNDACLALTNCVQNRDDDLETELAGKSIANLNQNKYPPCVSERGMFMSSFDFTKEIKHPYAREYNKYYKHLLPTPVNFTKFSAPAIPFFWMLPKNAIELAKQYELDFDTQREPFYKYNNLKELAYTKTWIQDSRNQKALFDCFFEQVKPKESLSFFYAKEVPFVEDSNRVLIGLGSVLSIKQPKDFDTTKNSDFNAMPWEHMVHHSIRPDFNDGFLFPYHEALEYQKNHPDFDPKQLAVIIPNEFKLEFSYATEHVSHDFALYVLRESVKKIELAQKLQIGENWHKTLDWLHKRINEVEELRGDYPGLGAALTAFGLERGHFLAQFVLNQIDIHACPWNYLDEVFKKPNEILTGNLLKSLHLENIELWNNLKIRQKERYLLLQLLSRFNLSIDQTKNIYDNSLREKIYQNISDKEIIKNPYLIYEISINSIDPISFSSIDIGLMLNRERDLLPKETKSFHPLSKERIRALTVYQLEKQADQGHTLYPETEIIKQISEMPIEPKCDLNPDYFNLASSIFTDKIVQHYTADNKKAYQLVKYDKVADFINKTINKRIKGKRHNLIENWETYLSEEINFKNTVEDQKAKEEKLKALEELANARFSILIGQAGSGKTTLLSVLASIPKIKQGNVLFLAPTGKAKVRMEENAKKYGVTAKTIAQFLYGSGRFNGSTQTYHLNDNPQKESGYKTVVIDECSMLTEEMLAATIQNIKGVQRLILVGDYRQLPPIGAGRPFFDIVNYIKPENIEKEFPLVSDSFIELKASARQTSINNKTRLDKEFAGLFGGKLEQGNTDEVFEKVIAGQSENIKFYKWQNETDFEDLLNNVLDKELEISDTASFNKSIGSDDGNFFNFRHAVDNVEKWQLLSPVKSKVFGTTLLNRAIHKKYKKDAIQWAYKGFKTPKPFGNDEIVYGDKVINLQNHPRDKWTFPNDGANYIANGEIGIAVGRFKTKRDTFKGKPWQLEVEFTSQKGYKYQFGSNDFSEENGDLLELAYALTIHKAQGSQFDTVVLVIPENSPLLSRELLYTALTRQVKKVIVLYQGNPQMLYNYTNDYYSATLQRITNLFYKPNITKQKDRFFERNLIHCASDGKMLRSKSEIIIYEALIKHDLNPEYEYKLEIDGITKRPDFYINDEDSGIEYYWEHLGMLNDPDYASKWEKKLEWYKSHDILPYSEGGGDEGTLIITEDDSKGGISVKEITELIEDIFDLTPNPKIIDDISKLAEVIFELRNDIKSQISSLTNEFLLVKKASELSDQKLELIYNLLDKDVESTDITTYYESVKNDFKLYEKLEDNSLKFMASAYYLKDKLIEIDAEDYSPFILQFSRAIENEILQKFYLPFSDKLDAFKGSEKVNFLNSESSNRSSGIFAKMLLKGNTKYTMGMMVSIIDFVWKPNGNNLLSSDLLQLFREHLLTLISPEFLTKETVKSLRDITQEYRNKAAHIEKINKDELNIFFDLSSELIQNMMNSYKE